MDNIKELYLEDEVFEDARSKFNLVLQKLLRNMLEAESYEGSITLKVDIDIRQESIPNHDPAIEGKTRLIDILNFTYKVTSQTAIKEEEKGNKNPQMELVWDKDSQMYVLQYIANTEQRSIFDKDFQENLKTEEQKEAEVPLLPGEVADPNALPGVVETDSEEDVIEGEYTECEDESEEKYFDDDVEDEAEDVEKATDYDEPEDDGYEYEEPETENEEDE